MTEPLDFESNDPTLPGLGEPSPRESSMSLAARRTIVSLEAAGYLDESHAVLCQLMLDLSEVVDSGCRQGKASAVAMAAAQILATYQLMVPESSGGDGSVDAFDELVADIRRSAAAPRNAT